MRIVVAVILFSLVLQVNAVTQSDINRRHVYRFSKLHPQASELASISYLFQGLPTEVHGTLFRYDDEHKWQLECYLNSLLNSHSKEQQLLAESIRFLSRCVFLDKENKPVLVIKASDRELYIRMVSSIPHLHTAKNLSSLVASCVLYFLHFGNDPTMAKKVMRQIKQTQTQYSKVLINNFSKFSKTLTTVNCRMSGWEAPYPIR